MQCLVIINALVNELLELMMSGVENLAQLVTNAHCYCRVFTKIQLELDCQIFKACFFYFPIFLQTLDESRKKQNFMSKHTLCRYLIEKELSSNSPFLEHSGL